MPTTKPQLTAWLKDASRTGSELAAAAGKFPETDRLIAAHTLALPATLSTLSHSSDKATRSKVAANPNTPPADYVRLGQQFPNEFLANPALDLLFLENPGLLGELPEALLLRVLKRKACPADFLVWAAGQPTEKVQLAVAMNPKAPAEALDRLRKSAYAKVRESLSAAQSEIDGDPETLFREAVRELLGALTPEEAQEAWAKKYLGLPQFRELSLIARLRIDDADNHVMDMVASVAANPNLPSRLLLPLAQFGGSAVRQSVAENPNTPVAVLQVLREEEARHLDEALLLLRPHGAPVLPEASVLQWLQRLTDFPPVSDYKALAKASRNKNWLMRLGVAIHPRASDAMREWLTADTDADVAAAARKKLSERRS
jgi:hypothetical protein